MDAWTCVAQRPPSSGYGDIVADTLFGEDCDDGNTNNADTCLTICRSPACGDGFRTGTEACDDGNNATGDGCSGACTIETGFLQSFQCGGVPSRCGLLARVHLVPGDFATVEAAVSDPAVVNGDLIIVTANTAADDPDISKSVTVVGTGQTIQGAANNSATIRVLSGAIVVIQGLTIRNSGNNQNAINLESGTLTLRDVTINQASLQGIDQSAGTTLNLERTVVTAMPQGGITLRSSYAIENSVLRNNSVRGVQFLAGSSGTFVFSNITNNPIGAACTAATTLRSSIVFNNTTQTTGTCTLVTSLVANPTFDGDGIHVLSTSAAVDAAGLTSCPAEDLDGDVRPINGSCDIGADERP